jgi:hypothetical protein
MYIGSCNTIKQETQQNETPFQQQSQLQQKINKIVFA